MIKSTVLLLLFFVTFSESQTEKISWKENYQLKWSDFQGKPDKNNPFVATTVTGIQFKYNYSLENNSSQFEFSVVSLFDRKKSWSKKDQVNAHVLRHEQTHFDITELHARKLRKILNETTFSNNAKSEIEQLYIQIEEARKTMQNQYDSETNHSRSREQEHLWQEFISKELKKYDSRK